MRNIYAQADRVIVWLGASDDGGNALEIVRKHAESKALRGPEFTGHFQRADYSTCKKLLKHDWFRRIWVLQEVGVARCVTIQCGLTQVNGYAFCEGLSRLHMSSLPQYILPIIPLIRGSVFRPRHTAILRGTLTMGELVDMYHSHFATVPHDKIYALLGLCADDLNTPCLRLDYHLPLDEVITRVGSYIFGGQCTVTISPVTHAAVIKGRGWILGQIKSVERSASGYDQQRIGIAFHNSPLAQSFQREWGMEWVLQTSAASVQEGDIACLLQGSSRPSMVRLCKSKITVIISTAAPKRTAEEEEEDISHVLPEKAISDYQSSQETDAIEGNLILFLRGP
ncbi:uncharacterized protein BO80DRAFT_286532 [Aspergillus ibericus CBS 121593]|uniref:Heterokaryon incompatibility domain-containing protein n=1 Tax=Aspergillus ibericus CBS 121593 TaxID=1448316 RepID=A0A395H7E3_9EURO|nr:hypothetical protein BO80DRAFT_286532 [Aspergillus ibericus CBS 121593]RAL03546.1 hypothetical protein BO80DRAFT_286532 [Aspergillus ibericus CBS 121593]